MISEKTDNPTNNKYFEQESIAISLYQGVKQYKFNINPWINIDINDTEKGKDWSPNLSINMNKFAIFSLVRKLSVMMSRFSSPDLYRLKDRRLIVNKDMSKKYEEIVEVNNRKILLKHVVVLDEQNPEIDYEGIAFMIDAYDNYSLLTFTEFEYLLFELKNLNMHVLSLGLINSYLLLKDTDVSEKVSEIKNTSTIIPLLEKPTIPDI